MQKLRKYCNTLARRYQQLKLWLPSTRFAAAHRFGSLPQEKYNAAKSELDHAKQKISACDKEIQALQKQKSKISKQRADTELELKKLENEISR